MKVLLAHPGTQYSSQVARALYKAGKLESFYTGLALSEGGTVTRLLSLIPNKAAKLLSNRIVRDLPTTMIKVDPIPELIATLLVRTGSEQQAVFHRRNRCFQRGVKTSAIRRCQAVIGFDTSSWLLAERCRDLGIPFILDQSIAHPDSKEQVYARLREDFPSWSEDVPRRLTDVREAEQREYELADQIVAASSFTIGTLVSNGVPQSKIRLNPYGVDATQFLSRDPGPRAPLRFVFVGALSARKGVPLLLNAWKQLQPSGAELWLVGPVSSAIRRLIPDLPGLHVVGSIPHGEVPKILQQCDVFVFPSYFEGFGLVLLEAMACGLPVITTSATAGPDILKNREGGTIVPSGDVDQLAQALQRYLDEPEIAFEEGRCARRIAEEHHWRAYGERWSTILEELSERP